MSRPPTSSHRARVWQVSTGGGVWIDVTAKRYRQLERYPRLDRCEVIGMRILDVVEESPFANRKLARGGDATEPS